MLNKFWTATIMMIFALIIILLFQGHQLVFIETMTASIDSQSVNYLYTNAQNKDKDV